MASYRQHLNRPSLQHTPTNQDIILPTTEGATEFDDNSYDAHAEYKDLDDGLVTIASTDGEEDVSFIPEDDADHDEEDEPRGSALHNDGYSPVNLTSGTYLSRKYL